MRKSEEVKKSIQAPAQKLSPELREFMHMLTMLDHQFNPRTTSAN